jgi:uncharacterized protein
MAETAETNLQNVARSLGLPVHQVRAAVELLDEGNTVPFITRYRKDQTGGLDEEHIRQIQDQLGKLRMLHERKQTILRSIEAQGKLTENLAAQIRAAGTTKRLEDLYLPYKPKKQTLATLARSRGLELLADEILQAAPSCTDLDARAADFVNSDRKVPTAADALLGAGHILAERFSERADVRQRLRDILWRTGQLVSKRIGPDPKTADPKTADPKTAGPAIPPEKATEQKTEQKTEHTAQQQPPVESLIDLPTAPQSGLSAGPPTDETTPPAGVPLLRESSAFCPVAQPPSAGLANRKNTAEGGKNTAEGGCATSSHINGTASADETTTPAEAQVTPPAPVAPKPTRPRQKPLTKAQLKRQQAQEKRLKALSDYFDYREQLRKTPPHRVLAINRGERSRVLRVKIEADTEAIGKVADELLVPPEHPHATFLRGCVRDALARLVLPGLEREIRRELTDRAEVHAVSVFARNLRSLLLQPPIHDRRVLAVDPGFKSGCKLVALDQFGNALDHGVIYLVGRTKQRDQAKQTVIDLMDRFKLSAVAIGNGTACRQTEDFFSRLINEDLKDRGVAYVIVNEAGASVYSTSRLGREEFPRYDATLRGAISIGRRLQDPLSELVKIEPASIGVGLYQHDVKAKHLRTSLDEVVESCVNYVGVNVNTASPALLRYVSGLNQLTARRIWEYRMQNGPFRNRQQLRAVPGLGEATFVQAAGFLKIAGGDEPLDTTWIHPESYEIAGRVLARLESTTTDLTKKEATVALAARIGQLNVSETAGEWGVGSLLLADILAQLARPGRDPREDLPAPIFKHGVIKLEDLAAGMELTGTVLNVVDFGAFVDIGMHDSGLVHVSQLADKFIRDPHDVVAVGDIVRVWVVAVDKQRRRVSLTMIAPGTKRAERANPRGAAKPESRPQSGRPQSGRPQSGRPQRPPSGARPRGKGPPRGRGGRPPKPNKPTYKPKSRPKPVVPITDAMKNGAEPMRSFGDLAQFYTQQESDSAGEKTQPSEEQPPRAENPVATNDVATNDEQHTPDGGPPSDNPPNGNPPNDDA